MPTIRDEAICIRHWDWSETSQTVSLFTREHGLLRGLAKGSRREKSPFSGGIELLTRGEVVAITRPSGAMATITAWDLGETYAHVRRSLRAFYVGFYLLDLVHHAVTDEDPHPALFDDLAGSLATLEDDPERALLVAQWAVLSETGYRPEVGRDVRTGGPLPARARLTFLPRLGGVAGASAADHDGWGVRPETVAVLRSLAEGTLVSDGGDPGSISRAARLLASYTRHVIGREIPSSSSVFGPGELLR